VGGVNDPGWIPRLGPTSTHRLGAKSGTGSEMRTTDFCFSHNEYEHPRMNWLSPKTSRLTPARLREG
jgi:hypothetical protein